MNDFVNTLYQGKQLVEFISRAGGGDWRARSLCGRDTGGAGSIWARTSGRRGGMPLRGSRRAGGAGSAWGWLGTRSCGGDCWVEFDNLLMRGGAIQ